MKRCFGFQHATLKLAFGPLLALAACRDTASIESQCTRCSVRLEELVTLGAPEDPASPQLLTAVARFGTGDFLLGPTSSPGEMLLFDPEGRLKRVVGRRGSGPGEFSPHFEFVATFPDSVVVLDRMLSRLSVIRPNGSVTADRQVEVPGDYYSATVLDDGRLIASASVATPEKAGLPLHEVDATG